MGKYLINGGNTLYGEISISGAKNSVLPILAGSILNSGTVILKNVPILTDTLVAIKILKHLGCSVEINENIVTINSQNINRNDIPNELVKKMRSSIIFLGSLISVKQSAKVCYPGGCKLGKRPIDFHLEAFRKMNISIEEQELNIFAKTDGVNGNIINLPFQSVGATQNIILASIFCKGTTVIKNAAKEPEIIDLIRFLNLMGANIKGEGTSDIYITGVTKLKDFVEYTIMPDRIEAGTFMCLAAATNSQIKLKNVNHLHLESLIKILSNIGCEINCTQDTIFIKGNKTLNNITELETAPYPLFPTDLQPQIMTVLTLIEGTSIIKENIFESRNKHVLELNKMGANIKEEGTKFIITGVPYLIGNQVFAKDLRGGAALIIAGLSAKGKTIVKGAKYVKRGYEKIEQKLQNIGADIKYIED